MGIYSTTVKMKASARCPKRVAKRRIAFDRCAALSGSLQVGHHVDSPSSRAQTREVVHWIRPAGIGDGFDRFQRSRKAAKGLRRLLSSDVSAGPYTPAQISLEPGKWR
jgi:hypothetical protein